MLVALIAGLLAMPWDKPALPPEGTQLVLTEPAFPDPPPEGSVIELPAERELPANWRTSEKASSLGRANAGLADLRASGCGQFCREQFYALRDALRGKRVILVDLRQEPHTFLNGAALAWGPSEIVGTHRGPAEIVRAERAWTQRLNAGKFTTATAYAGGVFADAASWQPMTLKFDIRESATEARLAAEAGWEYFRITAPDTISPRDSDLDRFITLVRSLTDQRQDDVWMHFHCDTGGNRTTLYLTLYDMMRNYMRASRPDLIARQHRLGGIALLAGPGKAERARFLERFYSYCWQCGPHFRRSWSSWSRKNP